MQEFTQVRQPVVLAVFAHQRPAAEQTYVRQQGAEGIGVEAAHIEWRRRIVNVARQVEVGEIQAAIVEAAGKGQQFRGAQHKVGVVAGVGEVADIAHAPVTVSGGKSVVELVHRK